MAVIRQCGFPTSVVVPYPFSALGNGAYTTTPIRTGHGNCWDWGTEVIDITPDEDDFLVIAYDVKAEENQRDVAFRGDGNTVTHLTLRYENSTDNWKVYRGTGAGTLLGTSSGTHANLETKFLEFKFTIHDTTGIIQIWLDKVLVLNLTGQDTKNGGTDAFIDTIVGISGSYQIDNLQIINGLGDAPTDRVGPVFVRHSLGNANGNASQWDGSDGNQTDNYLLFDDPAGTNDGDTTYIETSVASEKDQVGHPDIAETPVTVVAVDAIHISKDTLAGGNTMRQNTRISAVDYNGSTDTLTASYAAYGKVWSVSPATAVAWTRAEYNGSEFGLESL